MTLHDAAETLKVASAEVEWEYPLDYSAALMIAAKSVDEWDKIVDEIRKAGKRSAEFLSQYPGYCSGLADAIEIIEKAKERIQKSE